MKSLILPLFRDVMLLPLKSLMMARARVHARVMLRAFSPERLPLYGEMMRARRQARAGGAWCGRCVLVRVR